MVKAISKSLHGLKVKTITYDNGLEFSAHQSVNQSLNCQSYFCDPYSSYQKGGVENINGLIRQFIPKGTDLRALKDLGISRTQDLLNSRPRKTLHFKTPNHYQLTLAA